MRLNLPILDRLEGCQNILISGIGGGFDIFTGLPIYHALRALGKTVHLANYTLVDLNLIPHLTESEVVIPGRLVGVCGTPDDFHTLYCGEGTLAQWLKTEHNTPATVWLLPNEGGLAMIEAY